MMDPRTALITTDTTPLLPSTEVWGTMLSMAGALFKSGLLPNHIKSEQAALAVIQKGIELRVPPMYALSNIVVVQGKPTANAELMLALVYRDHGDEAVLFEESTATSCTVAYKRRGWRERRRYSFTLEEARQANLIKAGPWQQYPAAMLRARCISAVARMAFPDTIGGLFTPEELGAPVEVDDDGGMRVIDAPPPLDTNPVTGEITGRRAITIHEPTPPPAATPASQQQHDRIIELAGELLTASGVAVDLHADYTDASAQAEIEALEIRVADAAIGDLSGLLPTDEQRGKVAACVAAFKKVGRTIEPPPASFTGAEIEGWLGVKRQVLAELKATANKDRALTYASVG